MVLLDTNACIRVLNGGSPTLATRLQGLSPSEIHISTVTRAELLYGARHSTRVAANLLLLEKFLRPLLSVAFDERCAEHSAGIRAELAVQGMPIGPYDLLIAATARAYDLTLVTHNTREFSRVVGLRVEDWE